MKWKTFNQYRDEELRGLVFPSIEELEKCIDLLWEDPELSGCPSNSTDGRTLWVPDEAVEIIVRRGIRVMTVQIIKRRK